MDETFEFGLVSYATLDHDIFSAAPEGLEGHHVYNDFLSFLGMAQHLGIDFIPITWHSALEGARRGGTAEIQEMAIDLQNAFAFKRLSSQLPERRAKDMSALIAELAVLGHPAVRDHPHLSRLEGICWDIVPETDEVWPVLIFEKAPHGDLMSFMERGAGKQLGLRDRLGLCVDVVVAIMDMHMHSIIHGDIKPQNVLIFTDESQKHTAKVADFGYSTIFARPDAKIRMPGTEYWVAPEWNHRNFITDSEGARKMDVFSLGAFCLWLLFYNNDKNNSSNSDFLAQRRSGTNLATIASQNIKATEDLDEEKRKNLQVFFDHSLQYDPALRCLKDEEIVNLIAPERAQDRRMPTLAGEVGPLRTRQFQALAQNFLADSMAQLYLADYHVRKFVVKCLKESVKQEHQIPPNTSPGETRAFQLALCYKIGFGTDRDEGASGALLQQTSIRAEDLESKLLEIKRNSSKPVFRNSMYNDMIEKGQDFRVDYSERYRVEQQLERAISWYRKELVDLEDNFGAADIFTLIVKIELCYALHKAGHWNEAITLRGQVTQLMKTTKGERDQDTLASMSQLAAMHIDQRNFDDAERLLLEVRSTQESFMDAEHPKMLETINALAAVYRAKGRLEVAEDMLLPAIKIREQRLGAEHPDTLRLISSLAATYLKQRRLEEAENLLKKLVELRKIRVGLKHTSTLSNMSNLATTYYHQGKFDDAKELYSQVADMRTELLGEEHQETLMVLSNLASVYKQLSKLEDAERLEERLVKAKIRVFGKDNESTLITQGNLALTYAYQERWQEARDLGREVVDSKRKVIGPDHPSTLSSIMNLAEAYEAFGEAEEAKAILTQGMQDAVAAGRIEQFETKAIMEWLLAIDLGITNI